MRKYSWGIGGEGDGRCVWPGAFIPQSKAHDRSIHLTSTNNRVNKLIIWHKFLLQRNFHVRLFSVVYTASNFVVWQEAPRTIKVNFCYFKPLSGWQSHSSHRKSMLLFLVSFPPCFLLSTHVQACKSQVRNSVLIRAKCFCKRIALIYTSVSVWNRSCFILPYPTFVIYTFLVCVL